MAFVFLLRFEPISNSTLAKFLRNQPSTIFLSMDFEVYLHFLENRAKEQGHMPRIEGGNADATSHTRARPRVAAAPPPCAVVPWPRLGVRA
jgi:hypothetical protein